MAFEERKDMITAAYRAQFHETFELLCIQRESRLLKTIVNRGSIQGAMFTINDMGMIEMRPSVRFAETTWDVPEAGTRHAVMKDFETSVPFAWQDIPKLSAQVNGPYMKLCVDAYHREVDKAIFNALLDDIPRIDVYNGTPKMASLPATQKIAAGGKPFTKAKLIAAKAIFRQNECDEFNGEELYIAYDPTMLIEILSDPILTSVDHMAVKMMQDGAVDSKWMGVNWIPYNAIKGSKSGTAPSAGDERSTAMWAGTAVHFGNGENYHVDIGPRRDRSNTNQIYAYASMGAGRANEQKVVEIAMVAGGEPAGKGA